MSVLTILYNVNVGFNDFFKAEAMGVVVVVYICVKHRGVDLCSRSLLYHAKAVLQRTKVSVRVLATAM